jgi:hypothetical protein
VVFRGYHQGKLGSEKAPKLLNLSTESSPARTGTQTASDPVAVVETVGIGSGDCSGIANDAGPHTLFSDITALICVEYCDILSAAVCKGLLTAPRRGSRRSHARGKEEWHRRTVGTITVARSGATVRRFRIMGRTAGISKVRCAPEGQDRLSRMTAVAVNSSSTCKRLRIGLFEHATRGADGHPRADRWLVTKIEGTTSALTD